MLKIPANSSIDTPLEVPENITDFSRLSEEHNRYFTKNFSL